MRQLPLILFFCALLILTPGCYHPLEPLPGSANDTTSHDILWQLDVLGDSPGSVLRDVAILNDTLAYAVGEIYVKDLSGNIVYPCYNLAKWNGTGWELKRVTTIYRGNYVTLPLYSIVAFSPTDIWLSSGDPIHGDGVYWGVYHLRDMGILSQQDGSVRRVWGSSSKDLYFAGDYGTIVHCTEGVWKKLNSGTTLNVVDIYGAQNSMTGEWEILAVANSYTTYGRRILKISGAAVTTLSDSNIAWTLSSVWFIPGHRYYVAGDGIYQKGSLSEPRWENEPPDITQYSFQCLRGTTVNDLFAVGNSGQVLHYSGKSWHSYLGETGLVGGFYNRVAIHGNHIFAVGTNSRGAVVARGRRMHDS